MSTFPVAPRRSRAIRIIRDAAFRQRVVEMLRIYRKYPKAIPYKTYGLISNKINRLGEQINNQRKVRCNICEWSGNKFDAIATIGYVRRGARCPRCGSMERHRAMIETLRSDPFLKPGVRLLDVGGIKPFRELFESLGVNYVSISLGDPAMACMDVEKMAFPDQCFDLILDSHVLEYVKDYPGALAELWRVLKHGGRMLLTEAYVRGQVQTVEFGEPNPAATFMVRRFGDDLLGFLRDAGFAVTCWDHTGRNDSRGDYFFLCERTSTAKSKVQVA